MTATKTCSKCGVSKSIEEFHKHPKTRDRLIGRCRSCRRAYDLTRAEKRRSVRLRYKYTISLEEQQALLSEQKGCCAICETPIFYDKKLGKRLNTDHNHATGNVRGLLCTRCNTFVGMIEVPGLLFKARMYLQEADGTTISN